MVNLKYFFTSPFFVPRNSVQNPAENDLGASYIHCWPDVEIFWHYFFHLIREDRMHFLAKYILLLSKMRRPKLKKLKGGLTS